MTEPEGVSDEAWPALFAKIKAAAIARGYRFEVNADGTEERLIRPDGSVAVIAQKRLTLEEARASVERFGAAKRAETTP